MSTARAHPGTISSTLKFAADVRVFPSAIARSGAFGQNKVNFPLERKKISCAFPILTINKSTYRQAAPTALLDVQIVSPRGICPERKLFKLVLLVMPVTNIRQ